CPPRNPPPFPTRRSSDLVKYLTGNLTEFVFVGARMVGAKQKLSTAGERDADIGLRTTTVAAVGRIQGGGGECRHGDLFSGLLTSILVDVTYRSMGHSNHTT